MKPLTKRQFVDWKKIFANDATDKGLISKIYKQLIQFSIKTTKKNKQPYQKMGRRPKKTFLQRRYTDGQEAHEKTLNIVNYQGNANQSHKEALPYSSENGYYHKVYK